MPYIDPEQKRIAYRRWREANRDKFNEYKREWYAKNADRLREKMRLVAARVPPEVHAAHQRVYRAIKRGELVRPDTCSQCGQKGFIEAAHENYTDRMAIRWLCRTCHRREDSHSPKRGWWGKT